MPDAARLLRALRHLAAVPFKDTLVENVANFELRLAAGDPIEADLAAWLEHFGTILVNRLGQALTTASRLDAVELLRQLWVVLDEAGAHELAEMLAGHGRVVAREGDVRFARSWLEHHAPQIGIAIRKASSTPRETP